MEKIKIGGLEIDYLRDGAATQQMGAFILTVPPGSNVPPPHSHALNEECVYVIEGQLRYSVDAEVRDLQKGETMFTPKGAVHAFSNPFKEPAKALIVLSPDVGAQYFVDVAALAGKGGPPDKVKLAEIMARYGLKVAAPPKA